MKLVGLPQSTWAFLIGAFGAIGCQAPSQQPIVIGTQTAADADATTPAASASTLSSSQQTQGLQAVNNWDGLNDCDYAHQSTASNNIPGCASIGPWTVTTTTSSTQPVNAASTTGTAATGTAAATATATSAATSTAVASPTTSPSTSALALIQANCGSSCHAAGGQAPDLSTTAAIQSNQSQIAAALTSMFPMVVPALAAADQATITAWASGASLLDTTSVAYAGSIRVSLAHPSDAATNNYQLLFAGSASATVLGVCILQSSTVSTPPATCQVNGPGYVSIGLVASTLSRNFFMAQSAILENGLTLMIVTSDATGTVNDSRAVVFNSVAAAAGAAGAAAPTGTTTSTATAPSG